MFNITPRNSFIKTINDTDFTDIVRSVYKLLSEKYGYTARISDIFILLRDAFDLKEFLLLDFNNIRSIEFESWLVDIFIDWKNGRNVDFVQVYNAILEAGEFSINEKNLFISGLVEERLWAIFLVIADPNINM